MSCINIYAGWQVCARTIEDDYSEPAHGHAAGSGLAAGLVHQPSTARLRPDESGGQVEVSLCQVRFQQGARPDSCMTAFLYGVTSAPLYGCLN